MYHIKKDLRAYKSAELFYEGLERCMKSRKLDKISVTDVTNASAVSRATFYRNFDAVIDVLYWKCNELFKEVLGSFVEGTPDLTKVDSLILYVFQFWMDHVEILETLICEGRIDIIYNSFMKNADIVMDYICEQIKLPNVNYDYFIATRVGIFIGVFQTWITRGKKENAEELTKIVSDEHFMIAENGFIF